MSVPRRLRLPLRRRLLGPLGLAVLTASLLLTVPATPAGADAAAIVNDPGCTTNSLPRNDDGFSPAVTLPFTLNFFGTPYNQLYVNNNGNVTFERGQSTYTPYRIDADTPPIIAPFFADVDTRNPASGVTTYGNITFEGRPAFCVNWLNVGYYNSHADKLNSFQLILKDTSNIGGAGDFEMIFNYGTITWETGDASGGTNGLGGTSAGAGYSAGTGAGGTFFEMTGSLVNGAFLNGGPNALATTSNVGTPGRWRFNVRFTGLTPTRLLDTRGAPYGPIGVPSAGRLGAQQTITLDVTGRAGIPDSGVGAVVLNLTYTEATAPSFLTVWPSGTTRPLASNANPIPGDTRANLVIALVGQDGNVNIFNNQGATHVIADALGWYPVGSAYNGLVPARILDTRVPTGVSTAGPLPQGGQVDLGVLGVGGVPTSGVGSVVLNVTATEATGSTFVTVWPTGEARPVASNLNLVPGQTAPNLVIARVGAGGRVSLYNNAGSTHLVADVVGWLPDNAAYTGLTPARILDTRPAPLGPIGVPTAGPVGPGGSVNLTVTGVGGVPATGVGSVVLNVTATNATANTFVTVYPTGDVRPLASNLNPFAGSTVPNLVIARVGAGGQVTLFNNAGNVDLIADVMGWFPG